MNPRLLPTRLRADESANERYSSQLYRARSCSGEHGVPFRARWPGQAGRCGLRGSPFPFAFRRWVGRAAACVSVCLRLRFMESFS